MQQLREESDSKYERLRDEIEAQGYMLSLGEDTTQAREKLKQYLKAKLPRQTVDMLGEAWSGIPLPQSFGSGDPSDKACTFWSRLVLPYMSP